MKHKFKYSKIEILKLMRPIAEAMINKPKAVIRTAIEEIMPWDDYVAMVKDMEEYNKMDKNINKKKNKKGNETVAEMVMDMEKRVRKMNKIVTPSNKIKTKKKR